MKKIFGLALVLALSVGLADASVIVKTDKGSRSYPDGSTLNINAERDMTVSFYGVKVNVKKGEKLTLKCLVENGEPVIYVVGDNIDNVNINKNDFVSSKNAAMKINAEKGEGEVLKGNFEVTNNNGDTAFLKKGSEFSVGVFSEPTVDVNKEKMNETSYMEQERAIIEKQTLSPSAPTEM